MTTVGLLLMKLPSGSAASSITVTATITATIMIGRWSVMPTAVRIESIENTMSSRMIWKIAPPTLEIAAVLTSGADSSASGSTLWWISLVAFQIRNRPPAIRIRSRHEKAVSKVGSPCDSGPARPRSNTGAVRPTMKAMVDSRTSRMIRASEMPIRRTLCDARAAACWRGWR
jgi:hypothetical protein